MVLAQFSPTHTVYHVTRIHYPKNITQADEQAMKEHSTMCAAHSSHILPRGSIWINAGFQSIYCTFLSNSCTKQTSKYYRGSQNHFMLSCHCPPACKFCLIFLSPCFHNSADLVLLPILLQSNYLLLCLVKATSLIDYTIDLLSEKLAYFYSCASIFNKSAIVWVTA